ncbi:MAG TPA: IS1182 family transposase [Thermoclostridium sp.]|nr:IS1182 family transposase [Thermoclostridium sp.]
MNNTYYNQFFGIGQQAINFNLYQIGLPADDPVYTLKKVMEEMNFSGLTARYSTKGRKGYNPIMKFAVMTYANMRGVKAVDQIVELCERDIAFIWLSNGERPQRDAFYDFINNKLSGEILDDLHYQFIRILQREGLVTLKSLFIDGTKIEANANRYTFVWRGSINYRLAGLLDKVDELYSRYNTLITGTGYDKKYGLREEEMFVIEGMDRVREIIQKNRERKKTNQKKISNNTILEIDNISPLELLKLQTNLTKIAKGEDLSFVSGKGQQKSEIQKLYEEIEECGNRLLKYQNHFKIMGPDRNSYSKTDLEATFMRMKDDHMQNGQLKPAYNVQIAVENYFIIHTHISNDRTDYNTLIPVLEKHKETFGKILEEVTADSGYSSEQNLSYLEEEGIESYIKLQTHEKMKTRAYKNEIGRHYNMEKVKEGDTHYYLCSDGRKLIHERTETRRQNELNRTFEVYACSDCSGCTLKAQCLYQYDEEKDINKNKIMKVNENWEELKAKSHENIQSEKGILNRQIRSIQTEGHFGDIKENDRFRRFNYRSFKKVYKEFIIYLFGRNLNKYHKFIKGEIKEFKGKTAEIAA